MCSGQSHEAKTHSNARELSAEAWRNVFENNDLLCGFVFREQCQDVIRARLNGETLDRTSLSDADMPSLSVRNKRQTKGQKAYLSSRRRVFDTRARDCQCYTDVACRACVLKSLDRNPRVCVMSSKRLRPDRSLTIHSGLGDEMIQLGASGSRGRESSHSNEQAVAARMKQYYGLYNVSAPSFDSQ